MEYPNSNENLPQINKKKEEKNSMKHHVHHICTISYKISQYAILDKSNEITLYGTILSYYLFFNTLKP